MLQNKIQEYQRKREIRRKFAAYYQASKPVDLDEFDVFRGEAFPMHKSENWLDQPDALKQIDKRLRSGKINAAQAQACRFWVANGYLIVPGLIDHATIDATWREYEESLQAGVYGERRFVNAARTLEERTLDPHLNSAKIAALQRHRAILEWTDVLLGRKTLPFQTIMGHAGSQQNAHSDSIHMTTYPLGFLVANWIALEDIDPESGPLEYYPGSHKLRYLLSSEVGIEHKEFQTRGYSVYHERYEPAIKKECEDAGLAKQTFLAKKGDVLFWHANLVHGGSRRIDPDKSRKALVCHYFAEGTVTYHDLSGLASRLHKDGMYMPPAG